MINGHPLLAPPVIPANCVAKMLHKFTKPYTWEVIVWATEPPHKGKQARYELPAIHEQAAAQLGMERFSREIYLKGSH
jgi:hypothetical protein